MNKEYYIGVRSDYSTMGKLLERNMSRLNQKMADNLRTTAMRKGIKKTEQGERLEFFSVDKQEMDNLLDADWRAMAKLATASTCRPLVKVDAEVFSNELQRVNSKPAYQGGMAYDVYNKYKADLAKAFDKCVEVVGADLNTRKAKPKVPDNPFKVGSYLPFQEYGHIWNTNKEDYDHYDPNCMFKYADKRVAKAGKKFIEIEMLQPIGHAKWYNTETAKTHFNYTDAYSDSHGYTHGHAIPWEYNKDALEWVLVTDYNGKPKKFQWNQFVGGRWEKHNEFSIAEYGHLIPAHCHSYEMR